MRSSAVASFRCCKFACTLLQDSELLQICNLQLPTCIICCCKFASPLFQVCNLQPRRCCKFATCNFPYALFDVASFRCCKFATCNSLISILHTALLQVCIRCCKFATCNSLILILHTALLQVCNLQPSLISILPQITKIDSTYEIVVSNFFPALYNPEFFFRQV
jgi:hypothetical protein